MKIALAAIAILASATPAFAGTTQNPFAKDQAVLNLQGLDLSTAEGQSRLSVRIDQAARTVCGDRLSGIHLALEAKAQRCQAAVTADVRSQIETRLAATTAAKRVAYTR